VAHEWNAEEAASDLAAVDDVLAALSDAGADERLRAVAAHFERRYGAEAGPRVLGIFVRLCLYLERHGAELKARGLVDEAGRSVDRAFLNALLVSLGGAAEDANAAVAAVPARDVPDDAVEP
jgi:hypothetical protein